MPFPNKGGTARPTMTSTGSLSNPQVGDVWTIVTPAGVEASDYSMMQNRGAGPISLALTGVSHTVTSADIPPGGSTWPVIVRDITITLVSLPINVSKPVAPALRAISDRTYINQVRSASSKLIGGARTHKTGSAVTGIQARYANWFIDGFANAGATYTELGSGGAAEFTGQIEYPPTVFTPFLFSGVLIGTATDGGEVLGIANVSIPANTEVKVHSFQKQTGAGFMVHGGTGGSAGQPTVTSTSVKDITRGGAGTTDQTATGNWAAAGGADLTGNAYGPYSISGITTKPSVLILGTSIDHGEGGTQATVYNSGLICQQLSDAGIGFVNAGVRADSVRRLLTSGAKRIAIGNSTETSTVYIGGPVNDITSTTPVRDENAIFADIVTLAASFPGKNIVVATCTPLATAADGQTPKVTVSKWANLNNLIRGGVATYGWKLVDMAEAMSRPGDRDLCQWGATDITVDGTHPNNTGYQRIRDSGVVDISKFL